MFDQHFSDLNYLKIKLTMTAYKSLHRCLTYKFEVSLKSSTQGLSIIKKATQPYQYLISIELNKD